MSPALITLASVIATLVLLLGGLGVLLAKAWRRVSPEQALVVNKTGRLVVSFHGGLVLPVVHAAQVMDLTPKRVEVERTGPNAVRCTDGTLVDVKLAVLLKIPRETAAVLRVAMDIGCEAAASPEKVAALFGGRFAEAVDEVASRLTLADLQTRRPFKEQLMQAIGVDLDGFQLTDIVIERIERVERAERA